MFANLINIITAPNEAFNSLKQKPTVFIALAVIVVSTALVQMLYFSSVDFEFFIDQQVEQTMAISFIDISESELRDSLEETNLGTSAIVAAVGIAIVVPLMFCLVAGYLTLTSKFTSDGIGFKAWYSLAVWTSMPLIFTAIASIVMIFMSSDGMLIQTQINPLSLNNLLFQTSGPWRGLLNSLDIMQIWAMCLLVLGYQNWTSKPLLTSACVALAPYVLIYGIWSIMII